MNRSSDPRFDDRHAHTSLSYCAEGPIGTADYVEAIARGGPLRTVAITDHGFALYFPEDLAWSWRFLKDPSLFDEWMDWGNARLVPHLDEIEALREKGLRTGIEVEMMDDGRLTVDPRLMGRLDVIVGSVHWLPVDGIRPAAIVESWMRHTRELVRTGIHILGHPLRWLEGAVKGAPAEAVAFAVDAAVEAGVAIEINGHFVVASEADLLAEAVRRGAEVAFSTDSHQVSEIGRFDYHGAVAERAGIDLGAIDFWSPGPRRPAANLTGSPGTTGS